MIVINDVLPDAMFSEERARVRTLEYKDEVSPVDGVTYPGISRDTDPEVVNTIQGIMCREFNYPFSVNYNFLRRRSMLYDQPTDVHHDASMGEWACIVGMGGTSMLQMVDHKHDEQFQVKVQDNRLVFFNSELLHRHMPLGSPPPTTINLVMFLT